ncbi:hypothetical protein DIPPA_30566 [Diplonema papillatum]|nr:hypothetical protein DIPPA_30566 [Diplonema papillatum]
MAEALWRELIERLSREQTDIAEVADCSDAVLADMLADLQFKALDRAKLQTEWKARLAAVHFGDPGSGTPALNDALSSGDVTIPVSSDLLSVTKVANGYCEELFRKAAARKAAAGSRRYLWYRPDLQPGAPPGDPHSFSAEVVKHARVGFASSKRVAALAFSAHPFPAEYEAAAPGVGVKALLCSVLAPADCPIPRAQPKDRPVPTAPVWLAADAEACVPVGIASFTVGTGTPGSQTPGSYTCATPPRPPATPQGQERARSGYCTPSYLNPAAGALYGSTDPRVDHAPEQVAQGRHTSSYQRPAVGAPYGTDPRSRDQAQEQVAQGRRTPSYLHPAVGALYGSTDPRTDQAAEQVAQGRPTPSYQRPAVYPAGDVPYGTDPRADQAPEQLHRAFGGVHGTDPRSRYPYLAVDAPYGTDPRTEQAREQLAQGEGPPPHPHPAAAGGVNGAEQRAAADRAQPAPNHSSGIVPFSRIAAPRTRTDVRCAGNDPDGLQPTARRAPITVPLPPDALSHHHHHHPPDALSHHHHPDTLSHHRHHHPPATHGFPYAAQPPFPRGPGTLASQLQQLRAGGPAAPPQAWPAHAPAGRSAGYRKEDTQRLLDETNALVEQLARPVSCKMQPLAASAGALYDPWSTPENGTSDVQRGVDTSESGSDRAKSPALARTEVVADAQRALARFDRDQDSRLSSAQPPRHTLSPGASSTGSRPAQPPPPAAASDAGSRPRSRGGGGASMQFYNLQPASRTTSAASEGDGRAPPGGEEDVFLQTVHVLPESEPEAANYPHDASPAGQSQPQSQPQSSSPASHTQLTPSLSATPPGRFSLPPAVHSALCSPPHLAECFAESAAEVKQALAEYDVHQPAAAADGVERMAPLPPPASATPRLNPTTLACGRKATPPAAQPAAAPPEKDSWEQRVQAALSRVDTLAQVKGLPDDADPHRQTTPAARTSAPRSGGGGGVSWGGPRIRTPTREASSFERPADVASPIAASEARVAQARAFAQAMFEGEPLPSFHAPRSARYEDLSVSPDTPAAASPARAPLPKQRGVSHQAARNASVVRDFEATLAKIEASTKADFESVSTKLEVLKGKMEATRQNWLGTSPATFLRPADAWIAPDIPGGLWGPSFTNLSADYHRALDPRGFASRNY